MAVYLQFTLNTPSHFLFIGLEIQEMVQSFTPFDGGNVVDFIIFVRLSKHPKFTVRMHCFSGLKVVLVSPSLKSSSSASNRRYY